MLASVMELRHLRYFVAVAEEENVSRAALRLHVSQPALSRQVRDLEDEFGFALLERSAKSVRLTEAGRVFLVGARAVLERADEAVRAARAAAGGGDLSIGYAPSLTARILPPALRAFQAERPGVRVALRDLSSGEMLGQLREGRLQLVFTVPPPSSARGVRFEPLVRVRLRLAVAPGHRLARRRGAVTLAEAAREPLVAYSRREYPEYHDSLAKLFGAEKYRVVEEHDGVNSLIAGIEASSGAAIVPESLACFAGPRLKLLPLSPDPGAVEVGVAWLDKPGLGADAAHFLELARAAAKK
jgi:DNA-binding transcriptional LysR family regulator